MQCLLTPTEGFSWRKWGLQNLQQELRCQLSHTAEFVYLQSQHQHVFFCSYPNMFESCSMKCVFSKLLQMKCYNRALMITRSCFSSLDLVPIIHPLTLPVTMFLQMQITGFTLLCLFDQSVNRQCGLKSTASNPSIGELLHQGTEGAQV